MAEKPTKILLRTWSTYSVVVLSGPSLTETMPAYWWKQNLGPKDVAEHVMRVFGRGSASGLFIANTDFTDGTVLEVGRAPAQKVVILATTEELYHVMSAEEPLVKWIRMHGVERCPIREADGDVRLKLSPLR